jgi:3-methyl-2-oxobutanoate hydroxymethyltransferase
MCLSMGSGTGCDGQYLFATDVLGTNKGHIPRHAKTYRNLKAEYERLHAETIAAFSEFRADVDSGAYPPSDKLVGVDDREYEAFLKRLG